MDVDPPADLLIEIDLTNDSFNKFPLYAALRGPEVWRYKDAIEIWILEKSNYVRRHSSKCIPILTDKIVSELLGAKLNLKRPDWLRQARKQIRSLVP